MARQVKVNIELETGKKLDHYKSLVIKQDLFAHHEFELVVPFEMLEKQDESFFNKSHKDVCGKSLTISFEGVLEKESFDFKFKGIITSIAMSNLSDLSNAFILKGYSPTIVLEDSSLRRSFLNKSVEQIFDSVLRVYPGNVIKKNLNPRHKSQIKYCVQYDETNFDFLSRIAAEYGEWFYYDGKEIQLGEPGSSQKVDFAIDGIQSFDMSISLIPAKFKMSGYDYTKDDSYKGKTGSHDVDGLSSFGDFALSESDNLFGTEALLLGNKPVYDQSELDEMVKFRRSTIASQMIVFHGRGENPNIGVGTVIQVSGTKPQKGGRGGHEDFGQYRVTEIDHTVDDSGNYSNLFKAVPETVKFPPVNPYVKHPVGQTELATVTDNSDPDNMSRVKVQFYWEGDDKESDWIRVGTFYGGAGDRLGMQFIPEKEAQVVIGYELNKPERPFVITNLYPKKSGMRALKGSNDEKLIYTKAGNTIELNDKRNENKILITNANMTDTMIQLEFKDNGIITLKTNGKVEIDAQDSIKLSAQKKLTLEGQEIEINAQNKVAISGTEIKIDAQANAEIKAGASAKLSGAVGEVSATGPMAVKGAIVQIN